MDRSDEIARWDRFYTDYAADPTPAEEHLAQEIADILLRYVPEKARVLEVGCGSGHLSGLLSRRGFQVSLMDFSEKALEAARRYFERAGLQGEFLQGDLFKLGESAGGKRYDVVWNSGVLEHYVTEEAVRAVEQMADHSSHLVVTLVPNGDCFLYQLWRWKRSVGGDWTFGTEFAHRSMKHVFEAAGFTDVREHTCGREWAAALIDELTEDSALRALIGGFYERQVAAPHLTDYLLVTVGRVPDRRERRPISIAEPQAAREASLEEHLTRLSEAMATLSHELWTERTQVERLEARLPELEGKGIQAYLAESEALERLVSALQVECAMHRQALAERENARRREEQLFREAQARLEGQLVQERGELQAAQAAKAQLEAEVGQLKVQAQEARTQIESLNQAAAALRAERSSLQGAVRALEASVRTYERSFYFRWRRRWRRFVAEFVLGSFRERRKLLRDLWRLLRTGGRKVPKGTAASQLMVGAAPGSQPGSYAPEYSPLPSDRPDRGTPREPGAVVTTQPYDVLLFPIIEWEGRFQRPQQLGTQLARAGHRVFCFATTFAEAPAGQPSYRQVAERVSVRQLGEKIYWVQLVASARLARFEGTPPIYQSHLEDEADMRYLLWSLRALRERFGIANTLSIIDLPFWGPLATALPHNKVVYDCLDEHSGFETTGSLAPAQEAALLPKADLVLFTARQLYQQKSGLNPRCLLLPNACDYDHFAATGQPKPADLPETTGPVIGYYGAIAHWFDAEMISRVARAHPSWVFVLIGSQFTGDTKPIEGLRNVHLLGEKPYADLPAYLSRFDVAIIPFLIGSLTRATNPVKFYEYLAAGKPVVATPLPELLPYEESGLVRIAPEAEAFGAAIAQAISEDNDEQRERRRQFAREQTWEKRAEVLDVALRKHVYPRVSIIIITYNNWAYTQRCLDSVLRNSHYPDLEIVIVDNRSTDQTRKELKRLVLPNTKLVFSKTNLGFAGGNNRGMEQATGDILILLNNDTEVTPDWVSGIVSAFTEGVGMVGPVTNFVGNDQIVPFFVGKENTPLSEVDLAALLIPHRGRRREVQRLGFYCVAIHRDVYEKVGPLDEGYERGMFEDDDYCEQVRRAGYRLVIAEDVFIYHHGSASFRKLNQEEYHRIFARNRVRFENKWGRQWVQPAFDISVRMTHMNHSEIGEYLSRLQPKAVVTPTVDWHSTRQRPQQLARALARAGVLTFYITPNYSHDRAEGYERVEDNLFLLSVPDHIYHVSVDLLYVLWATNNGYLHRQAHQTSVYDYMDEIHLLREHCSDVDERHQDLLNRADLVTASAQALADKACKARTGRVIYLPNGVDYDHFHLAKRPEPPPDLLPILDLGKPVLGYYGALARWFDFDLVDLVAQRRSDWSVLLIGPDHDGAMERSGITQRHKNVFWLGGKRYGDLPQYLAWFDVAMVPFAVNEVTRSVSPVKLFEYMAGGKPIISTDLPECRQRPGVFVARDKGDFLSLLDTAYRHRGDAEYLDTLDKEALANTWDVRIRALLREVPHLHTEATPGHGADQRET